MPEATRTFRIFVSSTFSDLKAERNALQQYVFPKLRELCQRHGCRFQAIDLRWGVSEEAGRDQKTMKICLNEIARCQEVSPRPNFIVLIGDRYGWRPLPAEIPADEFMVIKRFMTNQVDLALLAQHYRLDENALYQRRPEDNPVGLYCLQRRKIAAIDAATNEEKEAAKEGEAAEWTQVESQLRRILLGAVASLNLSDDERSKYVASATEQEIMRGAMNVADAEHHVFCFFRELQSTNDRPLSEDLPGDDAVKDFVDLNDGRSLNGDAHDQLQDLKTRLHERLRKNVHEYSAQWRGGSQPHITLDHIGTLPPDLDDCLKLLDDEQASSQLCIDVWHRLARVILAEIALIESVSPVQREKEEHERFAAKRAQNFCGRAGYLGAIGDSLSTSDQSPFAVWGESGSGKSSLMARAAEQIRETNSNAELVVRFIGATPQSSDVRALLEGLCHEISGLYGVEQETVPADYNGLAKEFPKRLALATEQKPLVLMLDALDQLSDAEHGRNLVWLPTTLPNNVRLIVSTTPGQCLTALQRQLPDERILQLIAMPESEGSEVLDSWLQNARRTLSVDQRGEVLNKFAANGLPLYLKLAFEEARLWHSYDRVTPLATDVPGIINNLFVRLSDEANHGAVMVSRSLGYLAAARNGLSEDEILAVLSSDKDVMNAFKRRSVKSPEVEEIPIVVWSRLYFDLEPYLTERSADGTALLSFFHRQLAEVTAREYLAGEDGQRAHKYLADYFERRDYWLEGTEQYRSRVGEFPTSARRANLRKASEFVWQLRQVNDWNRLEQIHTSLEFLESKTAAGLVFELAQDFTKATRTIPSLRPSLRVLQLLNEAIRRDIQFIARHYEDYPQSLFQCLWNSCWWYDCPEAAQHYETSEGPWSRSGPKLYELLMRWRTSRAEVSGGFPWIRTLRPPPMHLGTSQRAILSGHSGAVMRVAISADGHRMATASTDNTVRVWDAQSGEELRCLLGHEKAVCGLGISADGRRIASRGADKTVRVWDAESGAELICLRGQEGSVTSVAISPDGRWIVSGCDDQTARVWDAKNGDELLCLRGHEGTVTHVAISADGRWIASSSDDVFLWNAETGWPVRSLPGFGGANSLAISPDGRWGVSDFGDAISVWDSDSGEELHRLPGHKASVNTKGGVLSLAISADGCRILSAGKDQTVRVWDAKSGEELSCLRGHEEEVWSVVISGDGQIIASGSGDGTARVWDAESGGEELRLPQRHDYEVESVAISADGRRIVSGGWDHAVRVWDAESGEELRCLRGHTDYVFGLGISADGSRITSRADHTLRVWDADSGEELLCLYGLSVKATATIVAISPDGRRIANKSGDDTVRVWETESGDELPCLHADAISNIVFSTDGARIITGCDDHTVRVWDAASGEELLCLRGHEGAVTSVAISVDGRRIVSGGGFDDATTRVWDSESGEELRSLPTLRGRKGQVTSVAISNDSREMVSVAVMDRQSWNTEADEFPETIDRRAVAQARAAGSDALTFRAIIVRDIETVIEDISGRMLASFPVFFERLAPHPSGRLWAGLDDKHVYVIALEGAPEQNQA